MKIETHEIPESEKKLHAIDSIPVNSMSKDVADKAIEAITAAYNDISTLTGGVAVEITNSSGYTLKLNKSIWWKEGIFGELGSFGLSPNPVEITNDNVGSYEVDFRMPFVPLGSLGGAYSMVIYDCEAFEVCLGIYDWYCFMDVNAISPSSPSIVYKLGLPGTFTNASKDELWDILKNENTQSSAKSKLEGTNFDIIGSLAKPGMNSYVFTSTVGLDNR